MKKIKKVFSTCRINDDTLNIHTIITKIRKILTAAGFLPRFSNSIRFSIPVFLHFPTKFRSKKPKIQKRNLADKVSFYKLRPRTAKTVKTEEHRLATKAFGQCRLEGYLQ